MDIQVDPKTFHDFYFKIAMPLRLPLTSRKILEEFVDIDVNSESVSKIIQRNQYFEAMLMYEIKRLGLKDNTPSLKAAIVMLGMAGVRDFVCALQMVRSVGRKHLTISADGKLDFKPKDHLKYALKTEEYLHSRRLPYADAGYAAGMMFDLMVSLSREVFEAPKGFEEYVAEVYKHGLKSAMVGFELSKVAFKNFGFSKFVFASCLIHDIGKIAMELLFPPSSPNAYANFRADIAKRPMSRDVIHFSEAQRYGLNHEYYSAQLAYYFQVFRGVERAILFHNDPYIIRTVNKDLYSLASLIALSSNVANCFRIPKDTSDPVYQTWFTPELKDFKIDPKLLLTAMIKLGRETF